MSGNPKLLLLDEPSEGLAPVVIEQLVGAMQQLARDNSLAILLVEQRADIALALAERCIVMDRGRITFDGASRDLAGNEQRLADLLGLG